MERLTQHDRTTLDDLAEVGPEALADNINLLAPAERATVRAKVAKLAAVVTEIHYTLERLQALLERHETGHRPESDRTGGD